MTDSIRVTYLGAAEIAVALLRAPAVAEKWDQPSALAELSVGALAAHLGRQVLRVADALATDPPSGQPIPVLEHYARSRWVGAGPDEEANVSIRRLDEREAAAGPEAVRSRTETALRTLWDVLPAVPADRVVAMPNASWMLTMEDFLVTRLLEFTVHCDDLAVSVDLEPPAFPAAVLDPVFALLCRLAVRRHGATAVLRALSRSERAPATISAL